VIFNKTFCHCRLLLHIFISQAAAKENNKSQKQTKKTK